MKNLRQQFKTLTGKMMMKDFNISKLLVDLEDRGCIETQKLSLGSKSFLMIKRVNNDKILALCRETSKERPKKPPSAVCDSLDHFPWANSVGNITFEGNRSSKVEPLVNFRVKGTLKDLKNADLVLVNMKEFKFLQVLAEIKAEDWQKEGVLVFRDSKVAVFEEFVKKLGYRVAGIVGVVKFRKSYWRKNLWNVFSHEEILVACKGCEVNLPEAIEYEIEQDVYKELSKAFSSNRAVEVVRSSSGIEFLLI
jgi:hypothetical protein